MLCWNFVCIVFQGCRADDYPGSFGCPPHYVINIHSAEVGFIAETHWNFALSLCWLLYANCSWPIDQSHVLNNCEEKQWCYLTPEIYNIADDASCSDGQYGNVIRIIYDCINNYKSEGLLH